MGLKNQLEELISLLQRGEDQNFDLEIRRAFEIGRMKYNRDDEATVLKEMKRRNLRGSPGDFATTFADLFLKR